MQFPRAEPGRRRVPPGAGGESLGRTNGGSRFRRGGYRDRGYEGRWEWMRSGRGRIRARCGGVDREVRAGASRFQGRGRHLGSAADRQVRQGRWSRARSARRCGRRRPGGRLRRPAWILAGRRVRECWRRGRGRRWACGQVQSTGERSDRSMGRCAMWSPAYCAGWGDATAQPPFGSFTRVAVAVWMDVSAAIAGKARIDSGVVAQPGTPSTS